MATLPDALQGQTPRLDVQKSVVVRLRVHRPGLPDETAVGVFVGKDQRLGYFITAYHAVEPREGSKVNGVDIEFIASPGKFAGTVVDKFDPDLDLGIVQTPVASLPPGLARLLGKAEVAAGDSVAIVGHPPAGEWSVWSGRIQNQDAPSGNFRHFITTKDDSLTNGYSGGPVFNEEGALIGMHIATVQSYGKSVKLRELLEQLRAWRVPTDNIALSGPGATPSNDSDAINKVIDMFEKAYRDKDAQALWKIYPNPTNSIRSATEKSFKEARSITVRVTERRIELHGDTALVTARYLEDYVPQNGTPPPKQDETTTFALTKKNGVWTITSH
jgi:ketosteroid isomerase-like protein